MSLKRYEELVSQIPMLQVLNEPTRVVACEVLLSIAAERDLEEGDILFAEGDDDVHTGVILVEGTMTVGRDSDAPVTIRAPEIMGEMHQFDDFGQRTATVIAEEDSKILEFAWSDFVAMCVQELDTDAQNELRGMLESHASRRLNELNQNREADSESDDREA